LVICVLTTHPASAADAQQGGASAAESEEVRQLKSAIAELEQSLVADPQNVNVRMSLANLYLRQRDVGRAIREFEQTLKLKPDHRPAYVQVAIAYLELQQNPGAAEITLTQALEHFPQDGALRSLMGHAQIMLAQKRLAENKLEAAATKLAPARNHFQIAIDNASGNNARAAAYLGLGSCYHLEVELLNLQKRAAEASAATQEASRAYHRAMALQPELRQEIRELEIELALPPPRFSEAYSLTHLSVTVKARIEKVRARLQETGKLNQRGKPK
jgi:tetratricopeptide (TPR) repeat protein